MAGPANFFSNLFGQTLQAVTDFFRFGVGNAGLRGMNATEIEARTNTDAGYAKLYAETPINTDTDDMVATKGYVDAEAGAPSALKAIQIAVVGDGATVQFNSTATLPVGSRVKEVEALIPVALTGSPTIQVGQVSGAADRFAGTTQILSTLAAVLQLVRQSTAVANPAEVVRVTFSVAPALAEEATFVIYYVETPAP